MSEELIPQLSLISPTKHGLSHLLRVYRTLQTNLDMEIIYIGPVNYLADDSLVSIPHRFIVSPVKSVQCCQIGMYLARGETVSLLADDVWVSPYVWDEAYVLYKESNDYKTIVSMNWWEDRPTSLGDRGNFKKFLVRFGIQLPSSYCVMSRKFFWELGGYDSNFIKRSWDLDFFLKAIKNGATVKYCTDDSPGKGAIESIDGPWGSEISGDTALYEAKWAMEDGKLVQKIEDRPFEFNDTIYTVSQGARDSRWP